MNYKEKFRIVKDFPKEGINFVDVTTVLNDAEAFSYTMSELYKKISEYEDVNVIVGTEARGFIFGAALASKMNIRFVPARKPGKLPAETVKSTYSLEYGEDSLEIHRDAIKPVDKVVIIDDLLATGGTALSVVKMVKELGGVIKCTAFVVEIPELKGREKIERFGIDVISLINFED